MTEVLRFSVPTLPKVALSPNGAKGGHWGARAKAAYELRDAVRKCAQSALVGRSGFERAAVGVEYRIASKRRQDGCYRPRDLPNMVSSLKPLYDGLIDAGVLRDDRYEHMELGAHRIVKVERYEDECLAVEIEELG